MASMRIAMKMARKEQESKEKAAEAPPVVTRKPRAKKGKAKAQVRKRRKIESSSESESSVEGGSDNESSDADSDKDSEISSSGSSSKEGSASSSSSDSDSDSEEEVDVESLCLKELGYGQSLYKDDEEREKFEAMPETEREKVLFERYEKRKSLLETLKLRQTQKAQSQDKKSKRSKKRGRALRGRLGRSKSKTTEKQKQEDARKDMQRRRAKTKSRAETAFGDSSISSSESDSSDDNDSDVSAIARKKGTSTSAKQTERNIVTLDDVRRMQLKRETLVKWIDEPYFNQIIGGFVRLSIGVASDDNPVKVYRLCEIVGINDVAAPYTFEGKLVDQELVLQFAKDTRNWRIDHVSNQDITDIEYQYWLLKMRETKMRITLKDDAEDFLVRVTEKIKNYVYTDQDISRKVEKKTSRRKRAVNLTTEKTEMERRIKYHELKGDTEMANKYRKKLDTVLEHLEAVKKRKEANQRAMIDINRRNYEQNEEERERTRDQRRQKKNVKHDNPYVSIPCRPKNLWSTGGESKAKQKEPAEPTPVVEEVEEKNDQDDTPVVRTKRKEASVHKEISIEVDLNKASTARPTTTASSKYVPVVTTSDTGKPRKKMSLKEYLRRQSEAQQL